MLGVALVAVDGGVGATCCCGTDGMAWNVALSEARGADAETGASSAVGAGGTASGTGRRLWETALVQVRIFSFSFLFGPTQVDRQRLPELEFAR